MSNMQWYDARIVVTTFTDILLSVLPRGGTIISSIAIINDLGLLCAKVSILYIRGVTQVCLVTIEDIMPRDSHGNGILAVQVSLAKKCRTNQSVCLYLLIVEITNNIINTDYKTVLHIRTQRTRIHWRTVIRNTESGYHRLIS
jgi:hypothetical protein